MSIYYSFAANFLNSSRLTFLSADSFVALRKTLRIWLVFEGFRAHSSRQRLCSTNQAQQMLSPNLLIVTDETATSALKHSHTLSSNVTITHLGTTRSSSPFLASNASRQRLTQRHHLQPPLRPIERRSFPREAEKLRNSSVTSAATAWFPGKRMDVSRNCQRHRI